MAHGTVGRTLLRLFGPTIFGRYFDRVFWDDVFPEHVGKPPGSTMFEIGCAPGNVLLRQSARFGYVPWGLEYTSNGVNNTRAAFVDQGFNPGHVMEGDIFDDSIVAELENRFDIVYSSGLIEHFTSPSDLIRRHIRLAAPGGFVVVSIPNLSGLNKALVKLLDPEALPLHNLQIMKLSVFRNLFESCGAEVKYAGCLGLFDSDVTFAHARGFARPFVPILNKLNFAVNAVARRFVRGRRFESQWTSPYLVAILQKRR